MGCKAQWLFVGAGLKPARGLQADVMLPCGQATTALSEGGSADERIGDA